IYDNMRDFTKGSHLKIHMVVGGVSLNRQAQELGRGTDLLIATPGRLIDLLDRRAVSLSKARFLVLDEADQMLDMGFIHALRRIAPLLPAERQTMLFSATMPKLMADLAKDYLNAPVRVEVSRPGVAVDRIRQSLHFVEKAGKPTLLKELLTTHPADKALVFARTKHGSEKLMKKLRQDGFDAGSIHGNKSQGQRDRAIAAFKAGDITVLVATDVAARGIDIENVGFVYNFDLPNVPENYVHRIGRTARAGADGASVAFCAPEEMSELAAIQKAMNKRIPVEGGAPWPTAAGTQANGGKTTGRPSGNRRRRRPGRGAGHKKAA
ncbi:MAG: DEAD/DEAH box helicase, partial [Sphingomonadaceae bacterium]